MTTTTILPEDEDPFNDLTDDPFNDDFEPLDRKLTFTENDIYFETLHNQEQGEYKVLKVGLEPFKNYISKLSQNVPEKKLGRFIEDSVQIQFFGNKKGEKILDEIREQNKKDNLGNISIPNTEIEFINYSYCPKCSKVYSFKDLLNYYTRPIFNNKFNTRSEQLRLDTSVCCNDCETKFLPILLVVDKIPKSEMQFLCRMQTINAVESYFYSVKNVKKLTKNSKNLVEIK